MGRFLRSIAFVARVVGCAAFVCGSLAHAGAFLQPPGEGQVITTFRFSGAKADFDANGHLRRGGFYSKSEVQSYAEYGVSEWMTLVFAPSLQHVHVQNAVPPSYSGLGDSELGARLRLTAWGPLVVSAQAGGVTRGDWAGFGHRRLTGKAAAQADIRLLAGAGFECGPFACFADAQVAWRSKAGPSGAERRADVTLGVRPISALLLLVQAFSSFSPGHARSSKCQVSLVYDLSKRLSVQIGGFVSVLGRNTPNEKGVVSAVWYRF